MCMSSALYNSSYVHQPKALLNTEQTMVNLNSIKITSPTKSQQVQVEEDLTISEISSVDYAAKSISTSLSGINDTGAPTVAGQYNQPLLVLVVSIQQITKVLLAIIQLILVVKDPIALDSMMRNRVAVVRVVVLMVLRMVTTAGRRMDRLLLKMQIWMKLVTLSTTSLIPAVIAINLIIT